MELFFDRISKFGHNTMPSARFLFDIEKGTSYHEPLLLAPISQIFLMLYVRQ